MTTSLTRECALEREGDELLIDTWLMSCRVLGRQVEEATMNLIAEQALAKGFPGLKGVYIPSAKNQMVAEHYPRLGFAEDSADVADTTSWQLDLNGYTPFETAIRIVQE